MHLFFEPDWEPEIYELLGWDLPGQPTRQMSTSCVTFSRATPFTAEWLADFVASSIARLVNASMSRFGSKTCASRRQ